MNKKNNLFFVVLFYFWTKSEKNGQKGRERKKGNEKE